MAWEAADMFCTRSDVEREAQYAFTLDGAPNEEQVSDWAKLAASLIVFKTEAAGSRTTPPASGISDTHLRNILSLANAVGAAYMARMGMAVKSGTDRDIRVAERLARAWESYMGAGAAGGGSLSSGSGGLIEGIVAETIATSSDARLLANDVTGGETELKDLGTTIVEPTFYLGRVD